MLEATFSHLTRISERRERQLWRRGVLSWNDFERSLDRQLRLFDNRDGLLTQSRRAMSRGDAEFFAKLLPRREYYRIALSFPKRTLFLDIETTGLSLYYDYITLVGWSLGSNYGVYIAGQDPIGLYDSLRRASAIVTFNGSLFDLPFLRKHFPDLQLPTAHIDLRFFARRAGLSGTQKEIEAHVGLSRESDLQEINGKLAPVLWHKYLRGDSDALRKLIRYNHADIEGMKGIFDSLLISYLEKQHIPVKLRPTTQFTAHPSRLRWARNGSQGNKRAICVEGAKRVFVPPISISDLTESLPSLPSVVGIDLTGSEERASGWCILAGRDASTQRILSDDDLVETTLAVSPTVVSIDSPLGLPKGRINVEDSDPQRARHGIMRSCERELRRRGVSVYPCLIPSMQRLTARGIRLATKFRQIGVPVIESYPGAAQDILGVPRKRASLDFLKAGLGDFGLRGHWIEENVSHDEVDAVTAALVGLFWWSGRFEGLGDQEEGQLIIPDLRTDAAKWLSRRVIGLSGPIAAGKTTAARILEQYSFSYGRFSQVLAQILQLRSMPVTRETLQELGQQIHVQPGQRWLCQQLLNQLPVSGNIVVDGLRHPDDHAYLTERYGPAFVHLRVDTRDALRQERYRSQGGTDEDFALASTHQVEANVSKLGTLAHVVIENDHDLGALERAIFRWANK
jgi:predicted nuclease with RNAse H fold/uncharacterized protein YprB with RNaseH-like and TPR domain/dephospho-CoA kinase